MVRCEKCHIIRRYFYISLILTLCLLAEKNVVSFANSLDIDKALTMVDICCWQYNIYMLIVIALYEAKHFHFSMQNIEQSHDLTRAFGALIGLTLTLINDWLCLSKFV